MFLILQSHILKSKQYEIQGKFIKDAILRVLNKLFLFGALIIALPKLPNHLSYNNIISTKFQSKQQKKDI
jgi:hypothetical protein